jgi:glycosyltransferase involved in cell wall biosynthesis
MDLEGAEARARAYRASRAEVEEVAALHAANAAPFDVRRVSWFIPGLDSPFYGGINTALRIADHLSRHHGVENQFVVTDSGGPEGFVRSGIGAAFPALENSRIEVVDDEHPLDECSESDVAIATLWTTAFQVARFRRTRRKAYLIQDFEPMFYPAGTLYALAEASYRFGLYGICNTDHLLDIYRAKYGGSGMAFTPAVNGSVFHPRARVQRSADSATTLFVYSRPGHWRNCWELAFPALQELKDRLGERIRILAAGSWAVPPDGAHLACARHLGLLDYRATGDLYRSCDMGLALTVSEHPSYLPLELMACGTAVVAFNNPGGRWLLRDEENCLLSERTVDDLADTMERMAVNPLLRRRLATRALEDVAAHHSNWADNLAGIYHYLCDPEGHARSSEAGSSVTISTSVG